MDIQITFTSLICNKHWRRIQMCLMFVILTAQTNYSYAVPQTSSGSAPKIESNYDKFKDETTVATGTMLEEYPVEVLFTPMKEFILLVVGYTHKGQQLTSPPSTVKIAFQSQARDFRFGEQTELLSIIDGERVAFGKMSYSQRNLGAGHVEILKIDVPLKTFLKLAHAKTVELKLGNKELRLGAQNFTALSAFADIMSGKTVGSTTPPGSVANQSTTKPPSNSTATTSKGSAETSDPASISNCPIQASNLIALRGFKIGASIQEVSNRFQGGMPNLSEPDSSGVRTLEVNFSRSKDAPGSTGLSRLKFQFLDERIYSIEAMYHVGKEWKGRPLSEFAYSVSQGLGVSGKWIENPATVLNSEFKLECGAVRLKLNMYIDTLPATIVELPWATAFLTLTDPNVESQLPQRRAKSRQKEQQIDAEKRKVFRP